MNTAGQSRTASWRQTRPAWSIRDLHRSHVSPMSILCSGNSSAVVGAIVNRQLVQSWAGGEATTPSAAQRDQYTVGHSPGSEQNSNRHTCIL